MNAPDVKMALPDSKAKSLIERGTKVVSASYRRGYPLVIECASGCLVEDVEGNVFLDCTAGIAVTGTGNSHPDVVKAITEEAGRFIHMPGTDLFHEPQMRLVEEIGCSSLPRNMMVYS